MSEDRTRRLSRSCFRDPKIRVILNWRNPVSVEAEVDGETEGDVGKLYRERRTPLDLGNSDSVVVVEMLRS